MNFARFMSGPIGRGARILVGIALLVWAANIIAATTTLGVVLLVLGVFFVFVGAANICVFAPLFGGPLRGKDIK
ncbi:MAG: YgaP-like transmembrane domain [Agromyces sp.]